MCSTPLMPFRISSRSSLTSWTRRPGCRPLWGTLVWPGKIQMLLIASSRNWYSMPCDNPWPEPRRTISMKIPQATAKPVRNERSLFARMVSRISCQVSTSNIGQLEVRVLDTPVLQADDPLRHRGHVPLVGDDDDRDAVFVHLLEKAHD